MGAMSGKIKTRETIIKYVEDEKLIEHILFFEKLFPKYEVIIMNFWLMMTGFSSADIVGKHDGEAEGILATHKKVDAPFALGYRIKNEKIVDFSCNCQ